MKNQSKKLKDLKATKSNNKMKNNVKTRKAEKG